MNRLVCLLTISAMTCALAACASEHHRRRPQGPQFHPPQQMLLGYDANHDGSITRAELEAGLKADFAKADTDHNGTLDMDEVRAVNQARWAKDASTTTPLVDWNQDGVVDYSEFANAGRALFDQLDRDGNGVLSPEELRNGRAPDKKPHKRRMRRGEPGGEGPGGGD